MHNFESSGMMKNKNKYICQTKNTSGHHRFEGIHMASKLKIFVIHLTFQTVVKIYVTTKQGIYR